MKYTKIKIYLERLSVTIMSVAAIAGMFELINNNTNKYVLVLNNSTYVGRANPDPNNIIRNEKDDTESRYISYSQAEITFGRHRRY
jgi:hypothetical protein